ncbi:MAG: hypothetical protein AUG44_18765 [Actinobacteria bacterium 13_1_20CM_3_71_11]|nr:MAG: hypothetical protein AUG44_18765 [Actinobacteria bacterium 13_1_20CM_3_71_11]
MRPLEPWQAEEFAAFVDKERGPGPFSSGTPTKQARDRGRIYGIWLDDTLAGGALYRDFEVAASVYEIGVWLAEGAPGRGLVTRAVRRLINWAVGVRGIERVEWKVVPDNARSIAVARRLGFARDRVVRSVFPLGGVRHDVEVWSLLAHEWQGR